MTVPLDKVLADAVNPEGITPLSAGAVLCAEIRQGLRRVLKAHDPEGYAAYKRLKYPEGKDAGKSTEHRIEATKFLFDRVRDLLLPYYIPFPAVATDEEPEEGEPEPHDAYDLDYDNE